jgi:hypothetical protein
MCDLPQLLLAHLQREARDARDRAGASREETEKQITATSSDLAAIDVALVVAVRQPCCDFPQVTGPDWRTALRTIGLWARCPAVYPDEFHAPPFNA